PPKPGSDYRPGCARGKACGSRSGRPRHGAPCAIPKGPGLERRDTPVGTSLISYRI
ncbi:hypothetical protein BgiBS90_015982, partial [Biomphalaria glabrata]